MTDPSPTLSAAPDEGDPGAPGASAAGSGSAPAATPPAEALPLTAHAESEPRPEPVLPALGFPEGEAQHLHPDHLRTQLIGHWITVAVMTFAAFVILSSLILGGALTGVRAWVVPAVPATIITVIALWGHRYARLEHERTSYVVSNMGCEIRRGLLWRRVINVPLSRIQHTDVTQGPLQRAYNLSTLVLYTAGTGHAKVELSGLAFDTAMTIREYLFARSEAHVRARC